MNIEPERLFTIQELMRYNGEDGPMYIAYQGIVYDVSECAKWRQGIHENMHFPGQDLSEEISDAPHRDEVFRRPCVKRVGKLI
jgi:predicted heme/steroid binding protein